MNKPVVINGFDDFLQKFDTFYFAFDSIQPSFCLEVAHYYYWTFGCGYSEQQLNKDILNNKNSFAWSESRQFYYPNTNMFSGDNSEKNIQGWVVTKKNTKKGDGS
jgi:hypothetical protein